MIILTIGEASRRLDEQTAIESWVTFHMRPATVDSETPGVHVRIAAPSLTLNLIAGEATYGDAFERPLTALELHVLELWQQRGLGQHDFRSGQLVAFLHQVYDVLEQGSVREAGGAVASQSTDGDLCRSGVPA